MTIRWRLTNSNTTIRLLEHSEALKCLTKASHKNPSAALDDKMTLHSVTAEACVATSVHV